MTKNLDAFFNQLANNIHEAVETSLEQSVTTIAEESLKEAPMKTGAMRDSMEISVSGQLVGIGDKSGQAEVKMKLNKNKQNSVKISYHTKYAEKMHELKHDNYTTGGTKWKYLQDPFNRNVESLQANIKKSVEEAIRK